MKKDKATPASPAPAPAPTPVEAPAPVSDLAELSPPVGAELVDSGDVDVILKFEKGDTITGIYNGYKEVKNKKYNTVDRLHKVTIDGEACGIWGTEGLDGSLSKIKLGETVWIGYAGKKEIASGNTMHEFKVARVGKVPF